MLKTDYLKIRKEIDFVPCYSRLLISHLLNLGLMILAYLCWNSGVFALKILSTLSLSVLMFRNFSLMHDATHGSLAKSKMLNNLSGILTGIFCLLPFEPWKQSHLTHHYWSGNLEKDPVMAIALAYPKLSPKIQKVMDLFWMLWLPALAVLQYGLFWMLSVRHLFKKPTWLSCTSIAAGIAFWSSLSLYSPPGFLAYGVFPALAIYLTLVEVVNFPHHLQMTLVKGETHFAVWEQYLTARTCIYPQWFAKYVVLNFNYHAEHHVFPDLPWYKLPAAHTLLLSQLGHRLTHDVHFSWNIENRKYSIARAIATVDDGSKLKRTH